MHVRTLVTPLVEQMAQEQLHPIQSRHEAGRALYWDLLAPSEPYRSLLIDQCYPPDTLPPESRLRAFQRYNGTGQAQNQVDIWDLTR